MLLVFKLAIFLSAVLLFWVQPLFGKMILPLLGGSPSVWNTCMVFYQAFLLLGYVYAHFSIKYFGIKKQPYIHLGLMVLALFFLPIKIPSFWRPPVLENPIPGVLVLMMCSIGLPFFILSASSPMIQKWFSNTNHPQAKDPYFLYVASNVGSLLSLFSFPFFLEPNLKISQQTKLWLYLFIAFILLISLCVYFLVKFSKKEESVVEDSNEATSEVTKEQRIRWLLLSFVPSSLMLGVTSYISIDISPVPLFWIIPLTLYLLTYILTFSRKQLIPHSFVVKAMPYTIMFLLFFTATKSNSFIWFSFLLHLITFFNVAMMCHGELSNSRVPSKYLTEFYIWISLGGFLGGVFNAILAPMIFTEVLEYPIAMILACMLLPSVVDYKKLDKPQEAINILIPPTALYILHSLLKGITNYQEYRQDAYIAFGLPVLLLVRLIKKPVSFGISIACLLLIFSVKNVSEEKKNSLLVKRDFFGIHRISIDSNRQFINLYQDTTLHGSQELDKLDQCQPTTYYHPTGPIGQLFSAFYNDETKKRIAAVGLGTGSIACYGRKDQEWSIFEIDPNIYIIDQSGNYFTYLINSLPETFVVFGDARLTMSKEKRKFDIIILDAFSSDAIPVHLITKEALEMYLSKLSENGIIAFHTSNRHLDLPSVLASLCNAEKLFGIIQTDQDMRYHGKTSSEWVLIARKREYFGALLTDPRWRYLQWNQTTPVWTDDYSNVISIIKSFGF